MSIKLLLLFKKKIITCFTKTLKYNEDLFVREKNKVLTKYCRNEYKNKNNL